MRDIKRLTGESVHDFQHRLIDERYRVFVQAPSKTGNDRYRRREYAKTAWWTLTGHLRGEHASRWSTMGKTFDQANAFHASLHTDGGS